MFFVTLATSLVSNKNGISGSSSGVPTPHSTELPIHLARVNNDHCHGSESQSNDYRKQWALLEVLTHYYVRSTSGFPDWALEWLCF